MHNIPASPAYGVYIVHRKLAYTLCKKGQTYNHYNLQNVYLDFPEASAHSVQKQNKHTTRLLVQNVYLDCITEASIHTYKNRTNISIYWYKTSIRLYITEARSCRTNIQPLQYTGTKRLSDCTTEASIHTRYKNRTNIQPLQYTATKRISRLYITEVSMHTRYHYNILVQNVYLDCTSQKLACTLGTKSEQKTIYWYKTSI